jgi:hypothetical protein
MRILPRVTLRVTDEQTGRAPHEQNQPLALPLGRGCCVFHRLGWNRVYTLITKNSLINIVRPSDHLESLLFLADYSVELHCFDSAEG